MNSRPPTCRISSWSTSPSPHVDRHGAFVFVFVCFFFVAHSQVPEGSAQLQRHRLRVDRRRDAASAPRRRCVATQLETKMRKTKNANDRLFANVVLGDGFFYHRSGRSQATEAGVATPPTASLSATPNLGLFTPPLTSKHQLVAFFFLIARLPFCLFVLFFFRFQYRLVGFSIGPTDSDRSVPI